MKTWFLVTRSGQKPQKFTKMGIGEGMGPRCLEKVKCLLNAYKLERQEP
jgi:hypothetical protein